MRLPNPIRAARYRRAMKERRRREHARKVREYESAKAELWQAYVHAETHTEARRLLTVIWSLSIEEDRRAMR